MHTTFVFVRHAEGTHNVAAELEGPRAYNDPLHEDALLTERGIQQAEKLQQTLEQSNRTFSAVYCSPSRRCQKTLCHAYPAVFYREVHLDDRLLEPQGHHICNKRAERSVLLTECRVQWNLLQVAEKNPYDGAHTDAEFRRRIFEFTAEMVATHPGRTVLVVGHHEWIRTWFDIFYHREVRLPNCGIICGDLEIEVLCVTPLLPSEPTLKFLQTTIRDVSVLPDDIRIRVLIAGLQRLHDDADMDHSTRIISILKKIFLVQTNASWISIIGWSWKDMRILLRAFSAIQDELYVLHEDDRVLVYEAKEDLLRWCTDDIAN